MRDLKGLKIGRLTVLEETSRRSQKSIIWKCSCLCGKIAYIAARDLTHSTRPRRGCGDCGDSKHPLYGTWRGILSRCENTNATSYRDYGGRGIQVCSRWKEDFLYFVADMGTKPSSQHSVERVNNEAGYFPDNCIWATASEQATNQRNRKTQFTSDQIVAIYLSYESSEQLAIKYNADRKTIANIKCLNYNKTSTKIIAAALGVVDWKNKKAIKLAKVLRAYRETPL